MSTKRLHVQHGFSLVELSIAVVIVALLVAGTMGGASLLRASGVKAVVAEANDFKGAMRQFEMLYEALPGDMRNADEYWTGATNGNGNRQIEDGAESARALHHLLLADFISGNYTGSWDAGGYILDTNTARSKLSSEAGLRMACCSTTDYVRPLDFDNHVTFFSVATSDPVERFGVLTPIEALGIDKKIDDGNPDQGFVGGQGSWNGAAYTAANCYSGSGAAATYLSTDANFKNREDSCQLMFAYDW